MLSDRAATGQPSGPGSGLLTTLSPLLIAKPPPGHGAVHVLANGKGPEGQGLRPRLPTRGQAPEGGTFLLQPRAVGSVLRRSGRTSAGSGLGPDPETERD